MPNFLFEGLLGPLFIAALLLAALLKILKITEKMSGEFGAMASEYAGKVVGVAGTAAIGVATGGASVAMRGVGGGLAAKVASSGVMERMATSNSKIGQWAGRQGITLTDKAKTGTWDIRETAAGKATLGAGMKAIGMDMGKASANAKGGYEGAQKRQLEADLKLAKRLEVSVEEKKKIEAEVEARTGVKATAETRKTERVHSEALVENAQRGHDNSATGVSYKAAQTAYDDAVQQHAAGTGNMAAVTAAEGALNASKVAHDASATADTLKSATESLAKAQRDEAAALATAAKTLGDAVADETKRRRESYAQQVEARHQTGSWDVAPVSVGFNSQQARETNAAAIRAGTKPDESEKELAKLVKELAKQMAAAGTP